MGYKGLVRLNDMTPAELYDRSSVHAGFRMQVVGAPYWSKATPISKVAAHEDPYQCAEGSEERMRALGNQRVDNLAKAGALMLNQPSMVELENLDFQTRTLTASHLCGQGAT